MYDKAYRWFCPERIHCNKFKYTYHIEMGVWYGYSYTECTYDYEYTSFTT